MILLTSAWFPASHEMSGWSASELANYGEPLLFSTEVAAFAHVEAKIAEWNKENETSLRLVDEVLNEKDGSVTRWVYGEEGSNPNDAELYEQEGFVWFFPREAKVEA